MNAAVQHVVFMQQRRHHQPLRSRPCPGRGHPQTTAGFAAADLGEARAPGSGISIERRRSAGLGRNPVAI